VSEFQLGSVFIHVKDVNEAANWYAKLLGKQNLTQRLGQFSSWRWDTEEVS
jgi:catechol-2,3-dioxygenase